MQLRWPPIILTAAEQVSFFVVRPPSNGLGGRFIRCLVIVSLVQDNGILEMRRSFMLQFVPPLLMGTKQYREEVCVCVCVFISNLPLVRSPTVVCVPSFDAQGA
jgi:hypothetical protein